MVSLTNIPRKVPKEITENLKEVLSLLGYSFSFEEAEEEVIFTTSLSEEEWNHTVRDAYAFHERDELEAPFPVMTAYTADHLERLAKLGVSGSECFFIYSKDQDSFPL